MVSFMLRPLYLQENSCHSTYFIGGAEQAWKILKRENSLPDWDLNSELYVVQPVASLYTDCATEAFHLKEVQLVFFYETWQVNIVVDTLF
jgi:hypothetical protein